MRGGEGGGKVAQGDVGFDEAAGDGGCAEGAHFGLVQAGDGAVGYVGQNLRYDGADGGRSGDDESVDGRAGGGEPFEVSCQFAGEAFDNSAEQMVCGMAEGDTGESAAGCRAADGLAAFHE